MGFKQRADQGVQRLCAQDRRAEGKGQQPLRRGFPRGPDRRGLIAVREESPVRGSDQGHVWAIPRSSPSARQSSPREAGGYLDDLKNQELAQKHRGEGRQDGAGARGRRARPGTLPGTKNALEAAPLVGKLSSCTGKKAGAKRAVHRRGRFRRRQRQAGPRPPLSGDSPAARKAAERGEEAAGSGAGQRGIPLAHHRAGHGHRRGFRPVQAQVQPASSFSRTPIRTARTSAPFC